MKRSLDSTSLVPAVAKTVLVEVPVPTIADFLIILAARERLHITLLTKVKVAIRCWFSVASARKLIIKRAVSVAPLHQRITQQGFPDKVHQFVLVSFTFKDTLLQFLDTTDQPQTKAQLELAIAMLGLAVPVVVGSLISHREEGTEQQLGQHERESSD